jgi:hypothetical protein
MEIAFAVVLIVFLAMALLIAGLEIHGGLLGDSSMVPGCLGVMLIVLAAVATFGVVMGHIVVHLGIRT